MGVAADRKTFEGDGSQIRSDAYWYAAEAAATGYDCCCLWGAGGVGVELLLLLTDDGVEVPVFVLRGGGGGGAGGLERTATSDD